MAPDRPGPVRPPASEPPPDVDLLALLDPDPARAEERLADLQRQLRRFLEWDCRDPQDGVQEVFARGLRRMREGVDTMEKGPSAYFFGIARNLIREGWKPKNRREQQLEPEDWSARASTARDIERTEAAIEMGQALNQLSPPDRTFIVRYAEEGPEDLARELGRTVDNVRVMAFRIRERLRSTRASRQAGSAHRESAARNKPPRRSMEKEQRRRVE